jgi:hypothetical protein
MAIEREPDNMLVSFENRMVSLTPTGFTIVVVWHVSYDDGLSVDLFQRIKFVYEPL